MEDLHAAIATHLRAQRPYTHPTFPSGARVFCGACGHQIGAGDGRFDVALLYHARRCADCYADDHRGEA